MRAHHERLVTCNDVVSMLRALICGELEATPIGETWDEIYAGNVHFALSNGCEIVIFNDGDCLDYVDTVIGAGRVLGDFDDWADEQTEDWRTNEAPVQPIDRLTPHEREVLHQLVKRAP